MSEISDIPAWVDGTLVAVDKIDVHRRGLRHPAVSVFVIRGREVLIQRRALGKYHTPGLWANTCCTHPDWGEDSLACANRRLNEELGISGLSTEFRDQVEYRAEVGNGLIEHEVVDIFLAQAPEKLKVAPNPDEVMDIDWLSFPALVERVQVQPETFTPWLRIYLDQYAERIFGDTLLQGKSDS